jgi:hypothetical protein
MPLHNRSADGQSDTHAAALRRIEGIEELVHGLTVNADTAVPHHHTHAVAILSLGPDQQLPRPVVDIHHRVRGVANKIQNDLLELDAIPGYVREIIGELRLQNHALSLKITQRQRNDLPRGVIEIE